MRGTFPGCCARVARGHATAAPRSVMNSRRLIVAPEAYGEHRINHICTEEEVHWMSALGHKRTCAVHQAMSALPPIATAKADICATSNRWALRQPDNPRPPMPVAPRALHPTQCDAD